MPMTGLSMVGLHVLYVVIQAGVEIALARQLGHAALDVAELTAIVRAIDRAGRLHLDVVRLDVRRPIAALLQGTVGKIAVAMDRVYCASGELGASAAGMAAGNGDLNARTAAQTTDLATVGAAIGEITSAVHATAQAARESDGLSRDAARAAADGKASIEQMHASMQSLAEAMRQIDQLTAEVDGMAFQTNILALNAAVEAARAGEHGRGFSVVASEVRALAERSATAVREIKKLTRENVAGAGRTMDLTATGEAQVAHIADQAHRISGLIQQISTAAATQADRLDAINQTVQRTNDATRQSAAQVRTTTAAITDLDRLARQLAGVVGQFALAADAPPESLSASTPARNSLPMARFAHEREVAGVA